MAIFQCYICDIDREKQRKQTPCYTHPCILPTPSFSQMLLIVAADAICSNDTRSSTPLVDLKIHTSFLHDFHNYALFCTPPPPHLFFLPIPIRNSNVGPEAVHTQHRYIIFMLNSLKAVTPLPSPAPPFCPMPIPNTYPLTWIGHLVKKGSV